MSHAGTPALFSASKRAYIYARGTKFPLFQITPIPPYIPPYISQPQPQNTRSRSVHHGTPPLDRAAPVSYIPDMSTELMPTEYRDPHRQQAHTLYVLRGYPDHEVSQLAKVPLETLRGWIFEDGWDERRTEFLENSRKAAAARVGRAVSDSAGILVERYLRVQQGLLDRINDAVDDPEISPRDLATLSKAASSNFEVCRSLLDSAKIARTRDDEDQAGAGAGTAMIQINVLDSLSRASAQIQKKVGSG